MLSAKWLTSMQHRSQHRHHNARANISTRSRPTCRRNRQAALNDKMAPSRILNSKQTMFEALTDTTTTTYPKSNLPRWRMTQNRLKSRSTLISRKTCDLSPTPTLDVDFIRPNRALPTTAQVQACTRGPNQPSLPPHHRSITSRRRDVVAPSLLSSQVSRTIQAIL
jgi:hypothetical protein